VKDERLYTTDQLETGPNGDLIDPSIIRVGRAFTVNWAFIDDDPVSYVYQVYDKHDRLIYVGITDEFASRWSAHLGKSWWARSVDIRFVMLCGYRSRYEARVVEALLISEHRPPCNTKPELKYLGIAQTIDRPEDVLTAELVPVGRF
jgi:hypothetical protein